MHLIRAAAPILALLIFTSAATAAEWQTIAPKELGFSVELPGEIQTRSRNQEPAIFEHEDEYLAAVGEGVAAIITMQYRLAVLENLTAGEALYHVIDTYTGACGGTAEEKEIKVAHGYAVEIIRQCEEPGITFRSFNWLDGILLYRVIVGGPDSDVRSADADRIFSSFKLVN